MASKKKGKGSKLARMSDEERARYLQHRAAIEEEARRRKEQLIATFMKNKHKKEETFARLNAAKINQQWRQTLRVLKCGELKQDMESLYFWFDHTASKKTKLIESLLEDLEEAECQYSYLHQCHMEAVDTLLAIYNDRINNMQSRYRAERDRMMEKAKNDIERVSRIAAADQEHLNAIICKMQQTDKEETSTMAAKHDSRIDEIRNKMLTDLENIINTRESTMETLWRSFQVVLQNHWLQTEDRRREYLNLRAADAENCQQIFVYHQQISSTNETLSALKNQLATFKLQGSESIKERKKETANCCELFHILRRKLKGEKETDRKKLCEMTVAANSSTEELEKTLNKGKQILQTINLCRKFETLDEKIRPVGYGKSVLTEEEELLIEDEFGEFQQPLAEEAYGRFKKLDKFWKRYNKVFLEKEALRLQHQSLLQEQKQLKAALKHCFSELANTPSAPPKVPLQIRRPAITPQKFLKPILLTERVVPCSGKAMSCSDSSHESSFVHTLSIQFTKS